MLKAPQGNIAATLIPLPPQNSEAEQAVLGSLLLDKDAHYKIEGVVKAENFYETRHQKIFTAIQELCSKEIAVDMLTITSILEEKKELELIGGVTYLAQLVGITPSASNVVHYANIVRKLSIRRNTIILANELTSQCYVQDEKSEEKITKIKEKILEFKGETTIKAKGIKELLSDYHVAYHSEVKMGIKSGLDTLDEMTTGWRGGNMITIMAKTGTGKTNMCIDFALAALEQDKKVMYITLEMSENEILDRFISKKSNVNAHSIRSHQATDAEIAEAIDYFSQKHLKILYTDELTTNQVMSLAFIEQKKEGLDMVIVDSLDLLTDSYMKGENDETHIKRMSRKFKQIGTKLNIPVFTPWQIDKFSARANGIPQAEDGKGSTAIAHNSDIVLFIRVNEDPKATVEEATLFITKHRAGQKGTIPLYFMKNSLKFVER